MPIELTKEEKEQAYGLAILVKKYWMAFLQEHIYAEESGLAAQGYHPTDQSDRLIISELIIIFFWVLSNTQLDETVITESSFNVLSQAHNVYLNNHNHESLLDEMHAEQFGYSKHDKIPMIEMPRMVARYREYDRILSTEMDEDPFTLYHVMVSHMLPVDELNLFAQLYFYVALHKFFEALRVDYRTMMVPPKE